MWKQIFKATLVAGLLDITAACLQAWFTKEIPPSVIFKSIASGAFGKSALSGGTQMMAMGLLFHFIIVFDCVVIFFALYPKFKFLHRSILLNAFMIALVAWVITNLAIVPLSKIGPRPFHLWPSIIAYAILVVCIGLPISIFATKYFKRPKMLID